MIQAVLGLVILFPLILMAVALSMERLEARVRPSGVSEDEVLRQLEQANASNASNLAPSGPPRALDDHGLHHHRLRLAQRGPTTARRPGH